MLKQSEAILAVADVKATTKFYREILGFSSEWHWGDPVTFGGVRWGHVHLMFCQQIDLQKKVEGHQHMFFADDIQSLYDAQKKAGAPIISDIENKPWNVREYTVRDINGYHLRFGGPVKYERPSTGADSMPSHIKVEIRKATIDEYKKLTKAVGWNQDVDTMPSAIAHSIFCVMAIDTRDGQTVGMTRVVGDGRYYTIWDVMVLPEYQGQKIGSELMAAAMAELRKIGPKAAFVGLFTGKPKFYERFGFLYDSGGMHASL